MKGKILEFDRESRTGTIAGDDGQRYPLDIEQWKSNSLPAVGGRVDFAVNGDAAEAIFAEQHTSVGNSKKLVAAVLAFFLGGFGAHKFYLGYTKQGLIMLLVFLFGFILLGLPSMIIGIIAFVEFILYLIKSDEEFEQTYVVGQRGWF